MGTVYNIDVSEMILIQETTKQNIYCLDVSEDLGMIEKLTHQYHDLNIHETLTVLEKVKRGLDVTVRVAEVLTPLEKVHPKVHAQNVIEAIGLTEFSNDRVISEKVNLQETIAVGLAKHVQENLVIAESATYRINKLMRISEILVLSEGLTGYKILPSGDTLPMIPASCYEPMPITPSSYLPVEETPTGTINGSNKNFGLTYVPVGDWLQIFYNGLLQRQGSDYNISGTTIVFVDAPLPGSTLKANYFR